MDGRLIGSAAVAAAEVVLSELEEKGTLPAAVRSIFHIAAAVGGLLAAPMLTGRSRDIAEGAGLAALPLAAETIKSYVKQALAYHPVVRVVAPAPAPAAAAPAAPAAQPVRLTGW